MVLQTHWPTIPGFVVGVITDNGYVIYQQVLVLLVVLLIVFCLMMKNNHRIELIIKMN